MKYNTLALSLLLLTGCQSTATTPSIPTKVIVNAPLDRSAELEGSKHKVWKEASYIGVRNELKDGETIIFKNVEARLNSRGKSYYYLGNIYSLDGQLLFDTKYSLQDLGVLAYAKSHIDKNINPEVIASTRGVRYHGEDEVKDSSVFSSVYWKTTGGCEPKALPIWRYKLPSSNAKSEIKERWSGLRLSCINNSVYVGFNNSKNIYAAVNEDITIKVTYPYSKGKEYQSKAISNTGVMLKVDKYISRILIKEDAIKIIAYSHANRKFTEVTAYNNGLAEAYSRINNLCTQL